MQISKQIPIIVLSGEKGEVYGKSKFSKQLSKVSKHPIIIEVMLYYFKNGLIFLYYLGYKKIFVDFFIIKNIKNII